MPRKKNADEDKAAAPPQSMSPEAHAVATKGEHTAAVMQAHPDVFEQRSLFNPSPAETLKRLSEALTLWEDESAAIVLQAYVDLIAGGTRQPLLSDLAKWTSNHTNEPAYVLQCLDLNPPKEVEIIKMLPTRGSQKLVFLAVWKVRQRPIVVKKILGTDAVLQREYLTHRFVLEHENIIKTDFLRNSVGEVFPVEEYLTTVLSDEWQPDGIREASNLLYDIARALQYLHDEKDLVHGDVKPDNLAKREDRFVLLDFGICRASKDFTKESVSATGSLRTRAPELLLDDQYIEPEKADIWALGATIFRLFAGRFPLFDVDEKVPPVSDKNAREAFENKLKERVTHEWESRTDVSALPEQIRRIVQAMLKKDPTERCDAKTVLNMAEESLAAFLSHISHSSGLPPSEEVRQLSVALPRGKALELMPRGKKEALLRKLREYESKDGFAPEDLARIRELQSLLEPLVA